jgi:hypothetical protein
LRPNCTREECQQPVGSLAINEIACEPFHPLGKPYTLTEHNTQKAEERERNPQRHTKEEHLHDDEEDLETIVQNPTHQMKEEPNLCRPWEAR